ncbi:hypothetical protein ACEPAF_4244 [Sanghuangporus sanghuang]
MKFSYTFVVTGQIHLRLFCYQPSAQNGPADWNASPFNPPALPLAVRSPYLNTWLQQGNNPPSLSGTWPRLWDTGGITGWYASAVVDDQAYMIMGGATIPNVQNANQTAVEFTATRTSFIFNAGPMQINASFISPVEPSDILRQSLPFSYLSMSASSTDGNVHNLRMYSDISGEFIAGNTSEIAQWAWSDDSDYVVLSMWLATQQRYTEFENHAQDATEYYALKKISGTTVSWAITEDTVNRANAANTSVTLGNTDDTTFRPVSTNWPTLGIAVDWGSVQQTQEPAVWAIGVVRIPSILYRTSSGSLEERYPYFLTNYSDGTSAAKAFLDDFSRVAANAAALDAQLSASGSQISSDYAHLLALSTRQAFGGLDITVSRAGDGSWNTWDVKAFMKNMGGLGTDISGDALSVSTVDTLYAAFPAFLYLNPDLGGYLLSPLLEYEETSSNSLSYAVKNAGPAYPNATADQSMASDYGIEESANMLIMTLAYSQRSGNGTFLSRHYSLLSEWAEYLGNNTLEPSNQKTADFIPDSGIPVNNQTNLALKGVLAIASMAKIAEAASNKDDQSRFNNTAISYIAQWQNNAIPSDNSHVNLVYGDDYRSGLIYNLYADKLLQLNLVTSFVYDVVTTFYTSTVDQLPFGLPLDSSQTNRTMTHWLMFAASTVTNPSTRDKILAQIHAYASSSLNNTVLSTTYNPSTGTIFSEMHAGRNSPASGSVFALLALKYVVQFCHDSLSFSTSGPSQLTADMNAPELFNHNIKMALQFAEVIQRLAKSASDGIEHAFHPAAESSPMSASADLASLRHYIEMFTAHLVNTGVGALPMISFPPDGSAPTLPTETELLEETTKAVTAMYARQKQIQDNNAVVASLLSVPDGSDVGEIIASIDKSRELVVHVTTRPSSKTSTPEHLHYLHDPDLGGNTKKCVRIDAPGTQDATLFVHIPPPQRGHPKHIRYSTATVTTMAARKAEIRTQETVFVKWGLDKHRVKALRHEAGFYANELRSLQGTFVPRLIGYYESTNKNEYFALSVFEHCFGGIPSDNAEYHRQYMMAACAIHAAGVEHGQLADGYMEEGRRIDHHVFFDKYGHARIVDFTRAERHKCVGAQLHVPGAVGKGKFCEELTYLEAVIGDRLTGLSAKDAERRRREEHKRKAEREQYISKQKAEQTMDAERLLAMLEVSMEYAALKNDDHCPKGMYIIPSADSILSWDGVLFVHQGASITAIATTNFFLTRQIYYVMWLDRTGYYADSILKFRVRFPFTYPARPPTVTFATDVFHPLVSNEDGMLNLEPRFSPWRPKQDHVFHLLHWIKVIFKKDALDNIKESDALNKEAFRYRDSTQSFAALATQSAMLSQTAPALFENAHSSARKSQAQIHDIVVRESREEELDPFRTKLGLHPWARSDEQRS